MDVQRYSIEPPTAIGAPYEHGEWVRFTDHEAALSHTYDLGWQAGYTQGKDDYRTVPTPDDAAIWNAALDAVAKAVDAWLTRQGSKNVFDHIEALRKPPAARAADTGGAERTVAAGLQHAGASPKSGRLAADRVPQAA